MLFVERLVTINLDPVLIDQNSVTTFKNAVVPNFWLYIPQLAVRTLARILAKDSSHSSTDVSTKTTA